MKRIMPAIFLVALIFVSCYEDKEGVLISRKFIDDSTYEIVCKGFPKRELDGVARIESSKRAALMNAYYFAQNTFDDSVAPERDGMAREFKIRDEYAIVKYVIKKE